MTATVDDRIHEKRFLERLNDLQEGVVCPICLSKEWALCGGKKLPIAVFKCRSCGYLLGFSQDRLSKNVDRLIASEEVDETQRESVNFFVDVNGKASENSQRGDQQRFDIKPKFLSP